MMRVCNKPGCKEPTDGRTDRCVKHPKSSDTASERDKRQAHYHTADWRNRSGFILARDPLCRICKTRPSSQVDHIIPIAMGGTDESYNLWGLCLRCNNPKTKQEKDAIRLGTIGDFVTRWGIHAAKQANEAGVGCYFG